MHSWATRTLLKNPSKGSFAIDKKYAIYYYENLDMC